MISDQAPLGSFKEFFAWSGKPRSWGENGRCQVWFGGEMPKALASVLDEHLEGYRGASGPPRQSSERFPGLTIAS
jgi:hypothetical protein